MITVPGKYAEEGPLKIIFEIRTRLNVENNHRKLIAFVLDTMAASAVSTRQPTPSGLSRCICRCRRASGHNRAPRKQAPDPGRCAPASRRWRFGGSRSSRFSLIVLKTPQMTANINSVKGQMIDAGRLYSDAPFHPISANPKRALR
jgi:type IV secretion system protein VirB5